jgi:hypothetical protein
VADPWEGLGAMCNVTHQIVQFENMSSITISKADRAGNASYTTSPFATLCGTASLNIMHHLMQSHKASCPVCAPTYVTVPPLHNSQSYKHLAYTCKSP